jgi:hypothetical protein
MDRTFKGKADFKGISLEHANDINSALNDVFTQFPDLEKLSGIKVVSPNSAQGRKAFKDGADAVFAYDPIQHGIYINKDVVKNPKAFEEYRKRSSDAWDLVMNNMDNLSPEQRKLAEVYKNAGRELVSGDSIHDLFMHELGHHVQWTMLDVKTNNLVGSRMSQFAPYISGYANANKSEYLAESFVAFMKGEAELLDTDYVHILNSNVKLERVTILSGLPEEIKKSISFTITENHSIIIRPKQMGKKLKEHCKEFGLDVSKEEDREFVIRHIGDILQNVELKVQGVFRGQGEFIGNTKNREEGPVWFYIKGEDVVVVDGTDSEFVTILKGGALEGDKGNKRVRRAINDYYSGKGK